MTTQKQTVEESTSRQEFLQAPEELRELVKAVLQEERQVMHVKYRPDIHKNILQHVKRIFQ